MKVAPREYSGPAELESRRSKTKGERRLTYRLKERRMKNKDWLIILVALAAPVVLFIFFNAIPQSLEYHDFADKRTFFSVPNANDVLSNIPFALAGIFGMVCVFKLFKANGFDVLLLHYFIFFIGIFLAGFGSAYYHYNPTNSTLVWDRLPMTIAFMAFFSSVIGEMINKKISGILLLPLLLIGLGSVVYWKWTEQAGQGDLRAYALVQFLPILLSVLIICFYKAPENYLRYIIALMLFYFLSKLCEFFDAELFYIFKIVSGHTLKHIFGAIGCTCVGCMLLKRNSIQVAICE